MPGLQFDTSNASVYWPNDIDFTGDQCCIMVWFKCINWNTVNHRMFGKRNCFGINVDDSGAQDALRYLFKIGATTYNDFDNGSAEGMDAVKDDKWFWSCISYKGDGTEGLRYMAYQDSLDIEAINIRDTAKTGNIVNSSDPYAMGARITGLTATGIDQKAKGTVLYAKVWDTWLTEEQRRDERRSTAPAHRLDKLLFYSGTEKITSYDQAGNGGEAIDYQSSTNPTKIYTGALPKAIIHDAPRSGIIVPFPSSSSYDVLLGVAAEIGLAPAISAAKSIGQDAVAELDVAAVNTSLKQRAFSQVNDVALPGVLLVSKFKSLSSVSSTSIANAWSCDKFYALASAQEVAVPSLLNRLKAQKLSALAETDAADPVAGSKYQSFFGILETNISDSLGRIRSRDLGLVLEATFIFTLSSEKNHALVRASESNQADPIGVQKLVPLSSVPEVDEAAAIASDFYIPIGGVLEVASSPSISVSKNFVIGGVEETNFATMDSMKSRIIVLTSEVNLGLPHTVESSKVLGAVSDLSVINAIGVDKHKQIGFGSEVLVAEALGRVSSKTIGEGVELSTVSTLAISTAASLGTVSETDAAFLDVLKLRSIAQVFESDIARATTVERMVPLGVASGTNLAFGISSDKRLLVGLVSATEVASTFVPLTLKAILQALETNELAGFNKVHTAGLSSAFETTFALQLAMTKTLQVGGVVELDALTTLGVLKLAVFGQASDLEIASALGLDKMKSLGIAISTAEAAAIVSEFRRALTGEKPGMLSCPPSRNLASTAISKSISSVAASRSINTE